MINFAINALVLLAPPVISSASPAPEWTAKFAGTAGWIGGDAVYSVRVNDKRVLWFFGDTFIGTVKDGKRAGAAMVNNTVGVMDGETIRFQHGRKSDGKPAAIFIPKDGKGYYWPLGGAMSGSKLVQLLVRVESTKAGGAFGFRQIGQELAVIDNPTEDPAKWAVTYSPLPFAKFEPKDERLWGGAVQTVGKETYIYGIEDREKKFGSRRLLTAKVETAKMADPSAWRFRTINGWSDKPENAISTVRGLATEFSVGPAPTGGFVLTYTENGIGDRIVARFAPEPHGPWSEPVLLYSCPEKANKKVFCYSAKAHHFNESKEMLVSYCVNGWNFSTSIEDQSVYRPQFILVKLSNR
jgi:hypothetical protein